MKAQPVHYLDHSGFSLCGVLLNNRPIGKKPLRSTGLAERVTCQQCLASINATLDRGGWLQERLTV